MSVHADDDRVVLSIDDESHELTRTEAAALRAALGEAVARRREFARTTGERRADGSYAVHRRGADSTGNSVVFDSFAALRRLYERLPPVVDATAVGEEGITGSRRHLLVRHFAEHPAFDCRIDSRSPLRVRAIDAGETETEDRKPGGGDEPPGEDSGGVGAPASSGRTTASEEAD